MNDRPKTSVQEELEQKDPRIVPYTNVVYLHRKDTEEHLWWGKNCSHCQEEMTEKTTTLVSKRNGWGFQKCDHCLVNCAADYPCEKWSQDMKDFFKENGFMSFNLFFMNGKRKPMTGNAEKELV